MKEIEKSLWDILKDDYGFKPHEFEIPLNSHEEFREMWAPKFWLKLFPLKTKKTSSDEWLSATINGSFYEVLMLDIWYVQLRKDGFEMFTSRRFDYKVLLGLLT
jgi:hypothetical protein